ncbi:hypothetical protein B296_00050014 [Ensete ventricosum]|uniref:Uncharacterized protein n=1 Tax=Ensete ventricosum TaxID=4639 RepID=A0A426YN35_ENSVE|nr:hypothetical protein B296_00050014 [Ensete ventricosum]
MLRLGVIREWVGEGELPKKRIQSEVAKALQCVGRGHIWRDRSPNSSHKNLKAMKMSLGERLEGWTTPVLIKKLGKSEDKTECDAMDSSVMVLQRRDIRGVIDPLLSWRESIGRERVKEVENEETNSKY